VNKVLVEIIHIILILMSLTGVIFAGLALFYAHKAEKHMDKAIEILRKKQLNQK